MVYTESSSMGWRPLFLTWLSELPDHLREQISLITALFEWTLPPLFFLVRQSLKEYIETYDTQLCVAAMRIFYMLFKDAMRDETAAQENMKYVKNWIVVSSFVCRIRCIFVYHWLVITNNKHDKFLRKLLF